MKYAILADIHANLFALEAVLTDSRAQECTHYACAGDVVGYGRQPRECVKIVRDMGMPCVKGNHDEYCSVDTELSGFDPSAAKTVAWTRAQLSDDDRQWLRDLKHIEIVDGFTLVHSCMEEPQRWGYVFNKLDALASFQKQTTPVCFFEHTHAPLAFVREQTRSGSPLVKGGTYSKFHVDAGKKYFMNPGSVGQPRDNNPKAAYAIYDLSKKTIELRRVDYDWKKAQAGWDDDGDAPAPVSPTPRRPISGAGHNGINLN